MDLSVELIIMLVAIAVSLISSFISKKKEDSKTEAVDAADEPVIEEVTVRPARKPKGRVRMQDLMAQVEESIRRQAEEEKKRQAEAAMKIQAEAPKPKVYSFTPSEEGQRVTTTKKQEEASKQEDRTGLHNRENLKRAIIFGEILAPKF